MSREMKLTIVVRVGRRARRRRAAVVEAVADVDEARQALAEAERWRPGFVHNVVAHPLLWAWPRLGQWLHRGTEP